MHDLDPSSPRVRWTLLAVATASLAATLVTCKSVTDNVLAPQQPAILTANCLAHCEHDASVDESDETDLHVAIDNSCKGDAGCLQRETNRHRDAEDKHKKKRKKCDDDCHHQGGGHGGR